MDNSAVLFSNLSVHLGALSSSFISFTVFCLVLVSGYVYADISGNAIAFN